MGKKIKASADSAIGGGMPGAGVDKAVRKVMEAVAKHMRFNVPTKTAVIKGQKIEYFSGSKAVDALMNSKWTKEPKSKDSEEPHFVNRAFAVDYCNKLLREQFFVRGEKVEIKHKEEGGDQPAAGADKESKSTLRKRGEKATDSPRPRKGEESANGEKKTKRKFRLEVHRQQIFLDTKEDVYLWRYDPPSYSSYLLGLAVVIGAIALTLQPLWPDSSREALWYFSVAMFILMAGVVALIIARWIIYGAVLVLTAGKLKFWIFPNLDNEKAGFFESFKPIHSVEWVKDKKKSKKKDTTAVVAEEREDENGSKKVNLEGNAEEESGERDRSDEDGPEDSGSAMKADPSEPPVSVE